MAKKKSIQHWTIGIILIILALLIAYLYKIYTSKPSIQKYVFIYVYPSMNIDQLADTLIEKKVISHKLIFHILAKEMKLKELKPGKYRITSKMTLPAIVKVFKNAQYENVTIAIHSKIFYYDDFIHTLDYKLMINRNDIMNALKHHTFIKEKEWMNYLFIKTYHVNWVISTKDLLDSIYNYYLSTWNDERKMRLKRSNLSQTEAMILASIVQHESFIYSEQKKIAGVYINRLKKNMPLQADPTLKYINHKMEANRVYHADKNNSSSYNTYKYKGLPPTTIGAVSVQALDAVLNYETHNYLYFCAKPDMSGYSNYSETFEQHLKYARQYQEHLNQLNIK